MRRTFQALALTLLPALAACATDPTEVVIVVDGEFAVPTEVNRLELVVTGPDTRFVTTSIDFADGDSGFPRTVGVLQGAGVEGTYRAEVYARLDGDEVVHRTADFEFVRGEIRLLRIDLLRACVDVDCRDESRTCGEGGLCERTAVPTDPWTGTPERSVDAGASITPLRAP